MKSNFGKYLLTRNQFEHFRNLVCRGNSEFSVVGDDRHGYRIRNGFSVFGEIDNSFNDYVVDLSSRELRNSFNRNFLVNALSESLKKPRIFSIPHEINREFNGNVLKFKKNECGRIYVPVYRGVYLQKSYSSSGNARGRIFNLEEIRRVA